MAKATATKAVSIKEQTRSQVLLGGESEELQKDAKSSGAFYKKIRQMRKDPTIALARELSVAAILASEWSIEEEDDAPEGASEFIGKNILPLRMHILKTSLFGCIDFGWQPYEKVFELKPQSNLIGLAKLKPLLQDNTVIIVDPVTGAFNGFKNYEDTLDIADSLLVNIRVEGTNWYGSGFSEVVEKPYNEWNVTNDAAVRYDEKIAGAHWVVHYPVGTTLFNGVDTDNYEIAIAILNKLQASGSVVIPRTLLQTADDMSRTEDGWEIEIVSAYPTSDVAFLQRLRYHDALKVRAYCTPERAVLEGQFGTKAESEAHADFAITNMELRHEEMVLQYNWHLINQILRTNWGEEFENTVKISVAPITDVNKQFLRQAYLAGLSNPAVADAEAQAIDYEQLREELGLHTKSTGEILDPTNPQPTKAPVAASRLIAWMNGGNLI